MTRRACVFNEQHLRRRICLEPYADYYTRCAPLSLGKDAPCTRPIERFEHYQRNRSLAGFTIDTREFEFSEGTME